MAKKCEFIKANGERCSAWALTEGQFCKSHDPSLKEQNKLDSARGGKAQRKFAPCPAVPIEITSPQDVLDLIYRTLQEVRNGKIDLDTGKAIRYIADGVFRAIEITDLSKRVEYLESVADQKAGFKKNRLRIQRK